MRRNRTRAATGLTVAFLLLQAVGAGVVAAQSTPGSTMDPADEIYVTDDGDAILVYESPPTDAGADRTEFGVDVDENLAYALVTDGVEEPPDVRGHLTVGATTTALRGEGGLSFPRPDVLEAFSLDLSGESTAQTSTSDLSLAATVRDESGMTGLLKSAETSGEVTTSADRLTATGGLDVRSNLPLGAAQSLDATVSESDAGYELQVDWTHPVPAVGADRWRNRTVVAERLTRQFEGFARGLGGSATVELRRHSLAESDGGTRLGLAYTVRFTGIDGGIESMARELLARNPDLTDEQVDRLASGLAAVHIEEASLSYAVDGRDLTGQFSLDVRSYDELALAYVEIAQAMDAGPQFGANVERARQQFAAQQAAGLEQRFTWDGSLTHPESGLVRAEFESSSRSTNWAAYVDELRARELPFYETTYSMSGGIDGDRVELSGRASMEGEEVFAELRRSMPQGEGLSPRAAAILDGLRESDPRKAKVSASYDGDGLRIEGGAAFGNLAAIRDALADEAGVPEITTVVGRSNATGGSVVMRVDGAVSGGATESDVRALAYVDDDTTVHLPGEWDREFPAMDTDRAESFLSDVLPSTGSSGPGFGPLVAMVAVLAAAGLLGRLRA